MMKQEKKAKNAKRTIADLRRKWDNRSRKTKDQTRQETVPERKAVAMLKQWVPEICPEEDELKQRLEEAEKRLSGLQLKIKEKKLPVIVLVEGWGAAGKGSTIGSIIGVAGTDIEPGDIGSAHIEGVYYLPKKEAIP